MVDIDFLQPTHWERVREIYWQGIATGQATFETEVPDWKEWDESHLDHCRLIAELDGRVVGWVALIPYSKRAVYQGVAEVSIYVASGNRGQGIGSFLMRELIVESEDQGIWTLQAGVFPENTVSIKLCKNAGFREVGTRKRIGKLNGAWKDVLLLERRSSTVGLD